MGSHIGRIAPGQIGSGQVHQLPFSGLAVATLRIGVRLLKQGQHSVEALAATLLRSAGSSAYGPVLQRWVGRPWPWDGSGTGHDLGLGNPSVQAGKSVLTGLAGLRTARVDGVAAEPV